nr:helix-turn-helix transcriptional regulator [Pseudonocardia acaciae]
MTDSTARGDDVRALGLKLNRLREEQHMSLRQVAEQAGISAGHLSRIERGERVLDRVTVRVRLAEILGVSPDDFAVERNHASTNARTSQVGTTRYEPLQELVKPISAALDLFDLPPDESVIPRPLPALGAHVRRVNQLAQAARYKPMVRELPGLLSELHAATQLLTGNDQQRVWALLAEAARCGHSVGIAIGANDLSVHALQHVDWAATHAGDWSPGWRAAREYLRVTAYMRARDYEACWRLNAAGVAHLDGTDSDTPGALIARGQLHLGASTIAGYVGDLDAVARHITEAGRIAAITGEQPERFWFGFGPTNVRVHRVTALVAAQEDARAVEAAKGMRFPSGWLPTRIGHFHLDLARAWQRLGKPDEALEALLTARRIAPGQARRHPLARDTVARLRRSARRPSSALLEYAAWIGLQ